MRSATTTAPPRDGTWHAWLDPWNLGAMATVLGLDYALKRFASHASAAELDFLLAPTAACVQLLTGYSFVAERGAGYFSRETLVMILPACAGVNFAVIAFTTLAACFLPRFRSWRAKLGGTIGAGMLAYGATVSANGTRIALGLAIGRHGPFAPMMPAAALHRVVGVVVYLTALLALSAVVGRVLRAKATPVALPLSAYLAVTLATPFLGGASASRLFCRHAGVVLGLTALAAAVVWLPHKAYAVAFTRWIRRAKRRARLPRGLGRARRDRERPLPG